MERLPNHIQAICYFILKDYGIYRYPQGLNLGERYRGLTERGSECWLIVGLTYADFA